MSNSFSVSVTKYFGEYLVKQRGVSSNTIKSYRDTFVQLLEFMECSYHIYASKISSGDLTKERITDFLDLRHSSVTTTRFMQNLILR